MWDEGRGLRGRGMFGAWGWGAKGVVRVGEGRWGREAVGSTSMVLGSCCASSSVGAAWRALRA